MSRDVKQLNERDNVAVNLSGSQDVPVGHKVALKDISKGSYVIKYGEVIGVATKDIKKDEWVHTHNIRSHLDEDFSYVYKPILNEINRKNGTFYGYKRENRRAGIRNEIYIIPTVGCVNSVAKEIAEKANKLDLGSIDGIYALTHQFGCSQLGNDFENLKKILVGLALNPNATYVLFVGLGCENNSINGIQELLKKSNCNHVFFYNCQTVDNDVEYGFEIIKKCVENARTLKRQEVSIEELCIGLKCGGSDAFSGLTANPTVGRISDEIISMGGSSILTEVPEMFGAEQILMNKCINPDVFEKYKNLIINFKNSYIKLGFPVYENPSPGNKEGGISTLEEKSLGCIAKAGSSPIVDVLFYGEQVKEKGLNVLEGPGNDLIASTVLAAAGCQLILFTTGRGTPFSAAVPTIKISSNNKIAQTKQNWIDFDASTMDYKALLKLVIDVASGKAHCKQENHHEIAFYKQGVTL